MSKIASDMDIARDIVVAMIQRDGFFFRNEYPDVKTVAEMIGKAYQEIANAVSEARKQD